jgi:hypothetical protein
VSAVASRVSAAAKPPRTPVALPDGDEHRPGRPTPDDYVLDHRLACTHSLACGCLRLYGACDLSYLRVIQAATPALPIRHAHPKQSPELCAVMMYAKMAKLMN